MPRALASGNKTVFHYRGNVTPPKDYKQWATLIRMLVRTGSIATACGKSRVVLRGVERTEPESVLDGHPKGLLQAVSVHRRSDQERGSCAQVGGPATAATDGLKSFSTFCEAGHAAGRFRQHAPLPDRCVWSPEDDERRLQLAKSRRGVLARTDAGRAPASMRASRLLHRMELFVQSARSVARRAVCRRVRTKTVMEANGLVKGYSFWTFSDIFEENYFPSVPFHGGFGLLNLHGIAKPTYRAFELLHQAGRERLLVDGLHETVDAWVVRKEARLTVLLTNHALPRHSIKTERGSIHLTSAPSRAPSTLSVLTKPTRMPNARGARWASRNT